MVFFYVWFYAFCFPRSKERIPVPGRLVRKMLSGGALLPVITQYIHSSGGERERDSEGKVCTTFTESATSYYA